MNVDLDTDFEGIVSHVAESIFNLLLHLKILRCVVEARLRERESDSSKFEEHRRCLLGLKWLV